MTAMIPQSFSLSDFRALGVCSDGLSRVEAFGGAIENTAAGWQAYINANPDAWRAPLFTAWRLRKRGDISCPDLIWRVARIAFREQPDRNATLRQYGETLGPGNWREARSAAYDAAAPDRAADLALAQAFCADAYVFVAATNIQVHGGIGFTWEHPAHLYLRRARGSAQLFGSAAEHRERYLRSKGA